MPLTKGGTKRGTPLCFLPLENQTFAVLLTQDGFMLFLHKIY